MSVRVSVLAWSRVCAYASAQCAYVGVDEGGVSARVCLCVLLIGKYKINAPRLARRKRF